MGYNKIIRSNNTLEVYTYEKPLPIRPRQRRVRKDRDDVSGMDACASDSLRQEQFEGKRKDNAARASMAFKRLILSNLGGADLPLLVSFTYNTHQGDIKQGYKDFSSFIQAMRYKFGKVFRYIAVPEFQKRGAVHFHALFWGLPADIAQTERSTRLVAGIWGHGFVDVVLTDGHEKISTYLSKYMAKSFIDYRLKNQKAYVCSRNLKRPEVSAGMNRATLELIMEELGVAGPPKVDKKYITAWLGEAHYKVYTLA